MLNDITIMGRLTKDPELRFTQSGTPVASFSIANDSDYKDKNGNRKAIFVDCVAWRSTAEYVSKYFFKGRMVVIKGSLDIRDWTDKDGKKRKSPEILVDNIYFADSKRDDSSCSGMRYDTSVGYLVPASGGISVIPDDDDEELPF